MFICICYTLLSTNVDIDFIDLQMINSMNLWPGKGIVQRQSEFYDEWSSSSNNVFTVHIIVIKKWHHINTLKIKNHHQNWLHQPGM